MKTLGISRGLVVRLDDQDFDRISAYRWFALPSGKRTYAARKTLRAGKNTTVLMHREVMADVLLDGQVVDHADGDGLNNTRINLRPCSHLENARNHRGYGKTSSFSGVSLKSDGTWQVCVQPDGVQFIVGNCETEREAAAVYNAAASRLYGDFARLNKVDPIFRFDLLDQHLDRQLARIERQLPLLRSMRGNK